MDRQLKKMDALYEYWADADNVVIPSGEPQQMLDWLVKQEPDTWHNVVLSWNYDHNGQVLNWILSQERCDRGTAARVFLVEGVGHWLWDALSAPGTAQDDQHVCNIVLRNWQRYQTAELRPNFAVPDQVRALLRENEEHALSRNPVLHEILNYIGTRDAESAFGSEDGKIVVTFDHWVKANRIELLR